MTKFKMLVSTLAGALSAAPVMAADFHALDRIDGSKLEAVSDKSLAAIEGGASCFGPGTASFGDGCGTAVAGAPLFGLGKWAEGTVAIQNGGTGAAVAIAP